MYRQTTRIPRHRERERRRGTQKARASTREEERERQIDRQRGRNSQETDSSRRGKRKGEEKRPHAHVYALRPASRIAYARACICKRAAWGDETADRIHEAPRRWNKNKRKRETSAGEREEETARDAREMASAGRRRGKEGAGTSDSNYLELRADNRLIRRGPRGFSCRDRARRNSAPHSL